MTRGRVLALGAAFAVAAVVVGSLWPAAPRPSERMGASATVTYHWYDVSSPALVGALIAEVAYHDSVELPNGPVASTVTAPCVVNPTPAFPAFCASNVGSTNHATWPKGHPCTPGRYELPLTPAQSIRHAALVALCKGRVSDGAVTCPGDGGAGGDPCCAIAQAPALLATEDPTYLTCVPDGGISASANPSPAFDEYDGGLP